MPLNSKSQIEAEIRCREGEVRLLYSHAAKVRKINPRDAAAKVQRAEATMASIIKLDAKLKEMS